MLAPFFIKRPGFFQVHVLQSFAFFSRFKHCETGSLTSQGLCEFLFACSLYGEVEFLDGSFKLPLWLEHVRSFQLQ
jgi:hypothetical protein